MSEGAKAKQRLLAGEKDSPLHTNDAESGAKYRRPPTVEKEGASTFSNSAVGGQKSTTKSDTMAPHDKSRKLGHRRVNEAGEVTYKKKPTTELMAAIQLGIGQSITSLSCKPKRDLLLQDFSIVETVFFPKEGSSLTPAHQCGDFRFKTYASVAFRYFRELFGIQPEDFLVSLCNYPLQEVTNPGASGSIFYVSDDDEFIIKTVQHKEAEFLQKLLPGYYMNQNQNPRTLLPKFYGLYCYQCGGKNIRFVVMNNLLPSSIRMHERYDLKGSTYKRKASRKERAKASPTLKDLDFLALHGEGGLMLEAETHSALLKTIERDCRVLQSFQIMDYSLLLSIHNLDQAIKDRESKDSDNEPPSPPPSTLHPSDLASSAGTGAAATGGVTRGRSFHQRLAQFSTTMEAIQAKSEPLEIDEDQIPPGGIPARSYRGERLLLYIGVIDILQSYRIGKKLEHAIKSILHDGDTISVHRPGFYAQRFQNFCNTAVFKKIPSLDQPQVKGPHVRFKKLVQIALKHSPTSRKAQLGANQSTDSEDNKQSDSEIGAAGSRPDVLPNATPPPTSSMVELNAAALALRGSAATPAVTSSSSPALTWASTPSHTYTTEATPSYTPSSSSCSSDCFVNKTPSHGAQTGSRVSTDSPDVTTEQLVVEYAAKGSTAMDQLCSKLKDANMEEENSTPVSTNAQPQQ